MTPIQKLMRPATFFSFFSLWIIGTALTVLTGEMPCSAQTLTTLTSFNEPDAACPCAVLVQGIDGNFYGTTELGESNGSGFGTVFKIAPSGTLTKLFTFCSPHCVDGWEPVYGLVQGTDRNFYGTTQLGGAHSTPYSGGTVFRITSEGNQTTLYSFCSQPRCTDGFAPGPITQAADNNFYGVAGLGGISVETNPYCGRGCGTVYKMTPAGNLTTLHNFCTAGSCADGQEPISLIEAADGTFYGTTISGGAYDECYEGTGCGTIFNITPAGKLTTLYSFCALENCVDGYYPAGLIQAADGNFYGFTYSGGANSASCTVSCGTIFKITPGGAFTTLYSFCAESNCADGDQPQGLVQATDGTFYGTTAYGGDAANCSYGCGTVFKVTPSGVLTTLHTFCAAGGACVDGADPLAALVQGTDGAFYGTTWSGGAQGYGTAFSLEVGLDPFVTFVLPAGSIGSTVEILGQGFKSTSQVAFNGVAATSFSVVSETYLTAVVPAGATTGSVAVTTSKGILTSKEKFTVLQ